MSMATAEMLEQELKGKSLNKKVVTRTEFETKLGDHKTVKFPSGSKFVLRNKVDRPDGGVDYVMTFTGVTKNKELKGKSFIIDEDLYSMYFKAV